LSSKGFDYKVSINGKKIVEHSYRKPITIKSNDSSSIELPMDVVVQPLVDVLKNLDKENADSAEYTLDASLMLDLPVAGQRQFNLNETVTLPAFQLPELKPKDIDVKKLRWKTSTLGMDFTIINPNSFPLKMKDMKYNVTIDKDNVMQGTIPGVTVVPPKSQSKVEVLLKIKNKEMPQMMWKALFEKEETLFAVDVTGELISKSDILKDSRFVMRTSGTLKDIKDAAKKL
jgi:LEA14-like dessication related protein